MIGFLSEPTTTSCPVFNVGRGINVIAVKFIADSISNTRSASISRILPFSGVGEGLGREN